MLGKDGASSTVFTPESNRNASTVYATAKKVDKIKHATYYSFRNADSTDYSDLIETSIIGVKNPAYY